jgi:hypothetical protein
MNVYRDPHAVAHGEIDGLDIPGQGSPEVQRMGFQDGGVVLTCRHGKKEA